MAENKIIHYVALGLISITFIAKIISLIFLGELHYNLAIFEFISIGAYFFYVGWLGFVKFKFGANNGKYMVWATILIIIDLATYYSFKGWM